MQKIKPIYVNLLLLAAVFFLMFLFFEIFFRVFLPQPTTLRAEALSPRVFEKSDYTPWKLKPLSMDRHISETGREFDVGVSINSYGLRDNEITYSELHNKTIIGAIGDSFTYGFGVELEESFHQVLEKLLIKKSLKNYQKKNTLS